MMSRSRVHSERTRTFTGHPSLQPDILITSTGAAPVVVEAEYMPATNAEAEAKTRLGLEVEANGRIVESVIALRYPDDVGDADDLQAALRDARLSYCCFTEDAEGVSRFPESGWLEGSVEDLADMVRLMSVPQRAVVEATNTLQEGIDNAARLLDELDENRSGITSAIARLLGMSNVPQTRRMACAIIANAMVFHERIAGMHDGVRPLQLVCGDSVPNPQGEVLAAWEDILAINYWAIFAIAKDILEQLPSGDAARVLRRLRTTAQSVNATGVDNAHDLTGRIFQRLIADRKYLATFYTLPASAALLAQLAVAKMSGVDWSNKDTIGKLRIADFACGTGALLSAVYEQIRARYERSGDNPADLHKLMMEQVLYGCDVMPSAIHITGSTLSGVEPTVPFDDSRLYTLAYGRQTDGDVKIGSLELLQSSAEPSLFNTSDPALRTGSTGEETAAQIIADIPDEGFDLIIMNPPFTNATNHEGAHADITNPAFAAFGATQKDQSEMGTRINKLGRGTCYNGNGGLASAFAALAHKKLKPEGTLALVMPLSVAAGFAWMRFRSMLANSYSNENVLSIAANRKDMSFSSDTGMADCLVIASKKHCTLSQQRNASHETVNNRFLTTFTSLRRRSGSFVQSNVIANRLSRSGHIRSVYDGPYGGTDLLIGQELTGSSIAASLGTEGEAFGCVRVLDYSLAQSAYALAQSALELPAQSSDLTLRTVQLAEISELGIGHRDIVGPRPRGPFDIATWQPAATYPSIWNHKSQNERRIVCNPDKQLQVRRGMEAKANKIWTRASRTHINSEFTFGSQPLAVAFTDEVSIGGRVWPNVKFENPRHDFPFALWANSTLGLVCYWWHSSRQQSSKASITIRSAESLPILDFRTFSDEQLATAEQIFDDFRDKDLMPAYLADADPNRALLDRPVMCDLLGFDQDTYMGVRRLAQKWCAEPSVHGAKSRPRGTELVT